MIIIIAIIYICYLIYLINSCKLISENPKAPLKKSTFPFLITSPPKNSKSASPLFLTTFKIFQALPAERREYTRQQHHQQQQ